MGFWLEMLVGRLRIGEDLLEMHSEALDNYGDKFLESAVDLIFQCLKSSAIKTPSSQPRSLIFCPLTRTTIPQ